MYKDFKTTPCTWQGCLSNWGGSWLLTYRCEITERKTILLKGHPSPCTRSTSERNNELAGSYRALAIAQVLLSTFSSTHSNSVSDCPDHCCAHTGAGTQWVGHWGIHGHTPILMPFQNILSFFQLKCNDANWHAKKYPCLLDLAISLYQDLALSRHAIKYAPCLEVWP